MDPVGHVVRLVLPISHAVYTNLAGRGGREEDGAVELELGLHEGLLGRLC